MIWKRRDCSKFLKYATEKSLALALALALTLDYRDRPITIAKFKLTPFKNTMAAIQAGPNLGNQPSQNVLNVLAPDPGPLPAGGAAVTPQFHAMKKRRKNAMSSLITTDAEIQAADLMLHGVEHRALGAVGTVVIEKCT